jgi:hypothetical protein
MEYYCAVTGKSLSEPTDHKPVMRGKVKQEVETQRSYPKEVETPVTVGIQSPRTSSLKYAEKY